MPYTLPNPVPLMKKLGKNKRTIKKMKSKHLTSSNITHGFNKTTSTHCNILCPGLSALLPRYKLYSKNIE